MIKPALFVIGLGLFVAFAPAACTRPQEATRQLTMMGFTDIKTTGYDFFACSEDDTFSTGFEATSPAGVRVTGVYCSGLFKAGTLRFY